MQKTETKGSQSTFIDDIAVLLAFLVLGAISGLMFAWLTTLGSLQRFFFIKGDKFLIPRYSYWFALSLLHILGLGTAYVLSSSRSWLVRSIPPRRLLLVALIIGLAAPLLRLLTQPMNVVFGPAWDHGVAPMTFLILVSSAMCILTADFRLLPVAILWNILFTAGGLAVVYSVMQLVPRANDWSEFVQWLILHAMWGLAVGNWLIWRQRVWLERGRAETHVSVK